MKKIKTIILSVTILTSLVLVSAFSPSWYTSSNTEVVFAQKLDQSQTINLFLSHGHCSTPFSGMVNNLNIIAPQRKDQGNPLENMVISFEIDPNTFKVCYGEEYSKKIKKKGLFINDENENLKFSSTSVYTMGIDWYQINGILSIKGVNKEVKFFATGIREPQNSRPTTLVLEGKLNLLDWGIDYDKMVFGQSNSVPNKWMHLNMTIRMN